MFTGNINSPVRTRAVSDQYFEGKVDYIIASDVGKRPAPQAYVVHQPAACVLPPHFHLEDQFQLVIRGSGKIGVHDLSTGSLHFAARHSGYGPLAPGLDGLAYLTIRAVTDTGMWALPESREKNIRQIPKRQITVTPANECVTGGCPPPSTITQVLIPPEESGIAAWSVVIAENQTFDIPYHAGNSGQFIYVFEGGLLHDSQVYEAGSCIWLDGDEQLKGCRTQELGVRLTAFQFPLSAVLPVEELMEQSQA